MSQNATMPPALAELARTKDFLKTEEFARVLCCMAQTIFKAHSKNGHYLGVRPLKVGIRLLWPIADIWSLLQSLMSSGPEVAAQGGA